MFFGSFAPRLGLRFAALLQDRAGVEPAVARTGTRIAVAMVA
jgi:hypothetical protein